MVVHLGAGIGRPGFVAAHGLYDEQQQAAAGEVIGRIHELGLRTIRVIVVDQHGVPRAKLLSVAAAVDAFSNGVDFSSGIYSFDTANHLFPPAFAAGGGFGIDELTGFPDIVIVPDPLTFKVLPWAGDTGWVLCDAYFSSGAPLPLDGRRLLRDQLERLSSQGMRHVAGLEVEFYVTKRTTSSIGLDETGQPPRPPKVEVVEHGYQYLSETRMDSVLDTINVLRDGLIGVGLPPRAIEDEWGPGQWEMSFSPMDGLAAADAMVLFRTAVKQLCRRLGLQASFMCWPQLPNFFPSGWHLHSSLQDRDGNNLFTAADAPLSEIGMSYVAGQLEHARAMSLFATPTVNGYRRFRPYSFAPDRVGWALENRGALIRVQGGPGDPSTHLENRLGEPSANPYLYLAADIAAGLDGIERKLTPPPVITADPYANESAPLLPTSLSEAIDEVASSELYRTQFGAGFVDYFLMMKRAEWTRYQAETKESEEFADPAAEWEMREYFEFF